MKSHVPLGERGQGPCDRPSRKGHVNPEADMGVRWPQAKEWQDMPPTTSGWRRQGEDSCPEPEDSVALPMPWLGLWAPLLGETISLLLNPQVRDDLAQQPQNPNADGRAEALPLSCRRSQRVWLRGGRELARVAAPAPR